MRAGPSRPRGLRQPQPPPSSPPSAAAAREAVRFQHILSHAFPRLGLFPRDSTPPRRGPWLRFPGGQRTRTRQRAGTQLPGAVTRVMADVTQVTPPSLPGGGHRRDGVTGLAPGHGRRQALRPTVPQALCCRQLLETLAQGPAGSPPGPSLAHSQDLAGEEWSGAELAGVGIFLGISGPQSLEPPHTHRACIPHYR